MAETRGFHFGPRDRRGLIAGVRTGQLVVIAAALTLAVLGLYALRGAARALSGVVVLFGTVIAFYPIAGRTLEEWVPVAARFSSAGARGARRQTVRPARTPRAPSVLSSFRVLELPFDDERSLAALHDARFGVLSAVLSAEGDAFALRDEAERARLVDAWASVLSSSAHGAAPFRLQWIVRSVPDAAEELRDRIVAGWGGVPPSAAIAGARDSYEGLVATARERATRHETLLVIGVRAATSPTRAAAAAPVLAAAVTAYVQRLRDVGIRVLGLASAPGLRAMVRRGFDASPVLGDVRWPWPVDLEESWGSLRTDGSWHATYWIAEWPRHEVNSAFLLPLLASSGDRRSLSVVMAPVPPEKAIRAVERARTSVVADAELRRRHGFALTARTRREQQAVLSREGELAEGHAAYRFSGYVTVSAATPSELEEACSRTEQAGALARLELRRLYGSQAEAFCCTLPAARGCR